MNFPGLITIIGSVAAVATTVSFLPQALLVIRTRDTKSISLHMYTVFVFGVLMWLAYGILMESVPIIAANAITALLAGIILFYKIKHG